MTDPTVKITLAPSGQLEMHTEHSNGRVTIVTLPLGKAEDIIRDTLEARLIATALTTATASCPTQWNVDKFPARKLAPKSRKIKYAPTLEDLGL